MAIVSENFFLDRVGLNYFFDRIRSVFVAKEEGKGLSSNDYTDDDKAYISNLPTTLASFQTSEDVEAAIRAAMTDISSFEFVIVESLPAIGESGKIYLLPDTEATAPDVYAEYIWVMEGENGSFELIGHTNIDLSSYWNESNLTPLTTARIDEIIAGVNS